MPLCSRFVRTRWPADWRRRLRDPIFWNRVVQLLKTALAAVLAWALAASVLDLPQPFLAPWAALLVVHATVYRTVSQGVQQVAATVTGVLLAAAVGHLLGLDTWAVAVLLVAGLLVGASPRFGAEATTVATTALVVLTTGYSDDAMLFSRLLDTAIGVAAGLTTNLLVWPPLMRRTVIASMDRIDDGIGELLADIGATLERGLAAARCEEWIERTRELDGDLDHAWSLVRQARESARMNPRRSAREVRDPQRWRELLYRMEQAVAEIRSMARTLAREVDHQPHRDPRFAERWIPLLTDVGRAVADADADAIGEARKRLQAMIGDPSIQGPPAPQWPVHGALIVNLRNILDAMDEVAAANPLGQPPVPLTRLRHPTAPRQER